MIDLIEGDAMELAEGIIPPGSVDLIFTDPPYSKKYHYCYKWLSKEAARVLKPTGFMVSYVGPYWKDKIMTYFRHDLEYFYDFVLVHMGNTSMLWQRRIISGYKSLLCYHLKGERPLPKTNILGKWNGTGSDKRFHRWGQDEITANYYIDCLTNEGDTVVDYFSGAGTFAVVCKKLNRRFIGFEKDHGAIIGARARIEGALGPREKGRQHEMVLDTK